MTTHDAILQLAAVAIDYPLTPAERSRLEAHLSGCQACVREAAGLRADAMAVANLPPITLPERRAAEILAAATHPTAGRSPLRLVGVAALLTLLLLGALVAGSELVRQLHDNDLSIVPPVSTRAPEPSTRPSSEPSQVPAAPGGVLAVTHGDETGVGTWVELVTLETGAEAPLGLGSDPAWGPNGLLVYACAKSLGDNTTICTVDMANVGEPQPEIASGSSHPVPAPDWTLVAVHRGAVDSGETWLMRVDGTGQRKLAAGTFLQWSPDGTWLLGQPESATFEVAIIAADGGRPRVLAPGYDPSWSPEGRRIVHALVDGEVASLREVDVADGEVRTLYTAPAGAALTAPAYLPGGAVVFVLDGDLWRLDPGAGSNDPVRLTTGLDIRADWFGDALTVSPDGAWVAFSTGSGAGTRVGIASVDGGYRMLDLGTGPVSQPQWAPASTPQPATPNDSGLELGATWTEVGLPAAADRATGVVEAVTAGGPGFVAVGRGCVGETRCEAIVWLSVDGQAWTRTPASGATEIGSLSATSGPELGMFDVAAGDPGIVAIGYAAMPNLRATTWFSADGTTWERQALGDASARVHAVAWDGRTFVMVGEDRSDLGSSPTLAAAKARAAVWTSPDGRTWTRVPHTAALDVGGFIDTMEDPASGAMRDVAVGPEGIVAVGSVCSSTPVGCRPAVWTSPDGTSWSRVADLPTTPSVLKAVSASEAGYVAVGAETCGSSPAAIPGGCMAIVLVSGDGRSWAQHPFGQAGDLRTVTRIGGQWFATSPDGPQNLWASADGTSWAPPVVSGGPATANGSSGISGWHFAATSDVAVCLGPAGEFGDPTAWVSRR